LEKHVKNRKLFFIFGIIAIALMFVLGACSADPADDSGSGPGPFPGNPSGKDTGSAWGFHDYVYVEITMTDGWITEVNIDADESPGVGAVAVDKAPAIIIAKNSVNIDVLAGATLTTTAIKTAGNEAIDKIIAANN
jgi:major membrane immunogen (membrane-anchored lipoprotein)